MESYQVTLYRCVNNNPSPTPNSFTVLSKWDAMHLMFSFLDPFSLITLDPVPHLLLAHIKLLGSMRSKRQPVIPKTKLIAQVGHLHVFSSGDKLSRRGPGHISKHFVWLMELNMNGANVIPLAFKGWMKLPRLVEAEVLMPFTRSPAAIVTSLLHALEGYLRPSGKVQGGKARYLRAPHKTISHVSLCMDAAFFFHGICPFFLSLDLDSHVHLGSPGSPLL